MTATCKSVAVEKNSYVIYNELPASVHLFTSARAPSLRKVNCQISVNTWIKVSVVLIDMPSAIFSTVSSSKSYLKRVKSPFDFAPAQSVPPLRFVGKSRLGHSACPGTLSTRNYIYTLFYLLKWTSWQYHNTALQTHWVLAHSQIRGLPITNKANMNVMCSNESAGVSIPAYWKVNKTILRLVGKENPADHALD